MTNPEDRNNGNKQKKKVAAKVAATIFITKDKQIILKSPLLKEAPGFLLSILYQALGPVVQKLGKKEESKILKANAGVLGKLKNVTKGAFGSKNRIK